MQTKQIRRTDNEIAALDIAGGSNTCDSQQSQYSSFKKSHSCCHRATEFAGRRNDVKSIREHIYASVALKGACMSRSGGNRVGHVCRDSNCRELASPDCERLNEDWRSAFQFARMTLISPPRHDKRGCAKGVRRVPRRCTAVAADAKNIKFPRGTSF